MTAKEIDLALGVWRRQWAGRELTDAALSDLLIGGAELERERVVAFVRAEISVRVPLPFRPLANQHLTDAYDRYLKGAAR